MERGVVSMGMMEVWKNALLHPHQTLADEKKNSSIGTALKYVAVAYLVFGLVFGLFFYFLLSLIPSSLPLINVILKGLGIAVLIGAPIFFVIMGIIGILIGSGIYWVIAKIFGGKGSYTEQVYLTSIFISPIVILGILGFIPAIGFLVPLLLGIYNIYLFILMMKEVHGFGTWKAVGVALVPAVIIVVLLMVLLFSLMASAFGAT